MTTRVDSSPSTSPQQSVEHHLNHISFVLSNTSNLLSSATHNKASLKRWIKRAESIADSISSLIKSKRNLLSKEATGAVSLLLDLTQSFELFVKKLGTAKFMHSYINKDTATARISVYNQELASIAQQLALAVEVDNNAWAEEDQNDRRLDLQELDHTLQHLVDNDYKILNVLELKQVEYFEAIEALQKSLSDHVDKALERNLDRLFMERALTCLRRASEVSLPPGTTAPPTKQNSAPPQWVLTSWEIDIGDTVAQGGFAEVLKATWLNHTTVAVKRLHMRLETSKMRDDFLREVKTWFPLRHPHILPLLGACATAERPFMVMPFMPRGHSLQYLDWCGVNQGKDCVEAKGIKLLYEVSLGLQYLHSRGVVHGDLKAVNILVDEHGSANVADFGFASLKQFSSTRNTSAGGSNHFGGTLRWMSPERLLGGRLAPPVDVYAFAMTCYEILSEGEVPMTEIPDALLYQHIVHSHLRPQIPQPSASTTYANTSKHLFRLMKACWDPNPLARPSFSSIAISMKSITTEARGKGSTVENIATAASESYATIRDPVPSVSDSLFRVDQHYQYMSQESDGSNSGIIGLGGGMLTKTVRGTQQHPFDGDDINLEFEPGTWGALVKDLLPMFPRSQQQRIKQDMLLFGRELVLAVADVYPTANNSEFCDFLYNLKLAAGYETSTVHFMDYMGTPSRTRAEQMVKANIHLSLSRLGGKTKQLRRGGATTVGSISSKPQSSQASGIFSGIWSTFYNLYYSPISLVTKAEPPLQVPQRNSDSTVYTVDTNVSNNVSVGVALGDGKLRNSRVLGGAEGPLN